MLEYRQSRNGPAVDLRKENPVCEEDLWTNVKREGDHTSISRRLDNVENDLRVGHGSSMVMITNSFLACYDFKAKASEYTLCKEADVCYICRRSKSSRCCGVEERRNASSDVILVT
ncbi:hypothetical protein TNCV_2122941 [Trichonephila clavipes]|nr:hypothetical protein TNCV_2122941 [Trichonephila clavipes]